MSTGCSGRESAALARLRPAGLRSTPTSSQVALLVVFVAVADGTGIGGVVQRVLLAVLATWMIIVARRAQTLRP
jgi:hypothetical protein